MTIIPLTDAMRSGRNAAPETISADDQALLDSYSQAVIDVVDRVGPAVVRLAVRNGDPARPGQSRGGSGSGVIVAPDTLPARPRALKSRPPTARTYTPDWSATTRIPTLRSFASMNLQPCRRHGWGTLNA